jgi:cell shape-determining protein MreD
MDKILGQYLPVASAVISLLAFIVSLITEGIKNIGFLKKVPTNIVVLVISILLCIITYLGACSIFNLRVHWYSVVGSFLGGFVVSYISTYGWEKFNALYLRYQRSKENSVPKS